MTALSLLTATSRRPRRLIRARAIRAAWWLIQCGLFGAGLALIVFVGGFVQ